MGRRLRDSLQKLEAPRAFVLVGLANEYLSYVTTPEEYDAQEYEGASTIFGPRTGPVIVRFLETLAGRKPQRLSIVSAVSFPAGPPPEMPFGPTMPDLNRDSFDEGLEPLMADATGRLAARPPRFEWEEKAADDWKATSRRITILEETPTGFRPRRDALGVDDDRGVHILTVLVDGTSKRRRWGAIWLFSTGSNAGPPVPLQGGTRGRAADLFASIRPDVRPFDLSRTSSCERGLPMSRGRVAATALTLGAFVSVLLVLFGSGFLSSSCAYTVNVGHPRPTPEPVGAEPPPPPPPPPATPAPTPLPKKNGHGPTANGHGPTGNGGPPKVKEAYWNSWLKEQGQAEEAKSVVRSHSYDVNFDLAAYNYGQRPGSAPGGVPVDPGLLKVLNDGGRRHAADRGQAVPARSRPLVPGRASQDASTGIKLEILRNPPTGFTRDEPLPSFADKVKALRVTIGVDADGTGCAAVGLSIWNASANHPLDYIVREIPSPRRTAPGRRRIAGPGNRRA